MWSNTAVAKWELNHLIVFSSIPLHRSWFPSAPGVCSPPCCTCACICCAWAVVGKVGKKVERGMIEAQHNFSLAYSKVSVSTSSKDPRYLSYRTVLCVRVVTCSSCPLQCRQRYTATLIFPSPLFTPYNFQVRQRWATAAISPGCLYW